MLLIKLTLDFLEERNQLKHRQRLGGTRMYLNLFHLDMRWSSCTQKYNYKQYLEAVLIFLVQMRLDSAKGGSAIRIITHIETDQQNQKCYNCSEGKEDNV